MRTVSVIIPVLNNAKGLDGLLQALLAQTYPREAMEIVVVDNHSTDSTPEVARSYEQGNPRLIKVLQHEHRGIARARNAGIKQARGEIIAMTDSDCIPAADWLEHGVDSLEATGVDLLAGRTQFTFSARPSAAEFYDSITQLQSRHTVPNRGTAQTANLFARRRVFETMALFDTQADSGEDTRWTSAAVGAGFRIAYSDETVVLHPARRFGELLGKRFRLGSGHPATWRARKVSRAEILRRIIRNLAPPRRSRLVKLVRERGTTEMMSRLAGMWWVAWACGFATNLGRLSGLLTSRRRPAPG